MYFLSFFFFLINQQQRPIPQGSLPPAPVVAASRILGLRLQLRATAGQTVGLQPGLASRLAAGSWGNPSGLLNKGQSWILAMSSVSLVPNTGPGSPCAELLGRQDYWAQSPTRATPATPSGLEALTIPSQVQRVLGKQEKVCVGHMGLRGMPRISEEQVMISRKSGLAGVSSLTEFFLKEVSLGKVGI